LKINLKLMLTEQEKIAAAKAAYEKFLTAISELLIEQKEMFGKILQKMEERKTNAENKKRGNGFINS